MPCSIRILISSCKEWPSFHAFRLAISMEIARSPAYFSGDLRVSGSVQRERHLLGGALSVLVVRLNNALHQMMAYHIIFVKEIKCNAVHVLQDVDCFNQSAAFGIG